MSLSGRSSLKIAAILTLLFLLCALTWSSLRLHHDNDGWHSEVSNPFGDDELDFHDDHPTHPPPPPPPPISEPDPASEPSQDPASDPVLGAISNISDIQNATLGFQKIYVLSMPNRRDKRDITALAALVSGMEIEFIDGPSGAEISKQERPDNWEKMFDTDNTVEASLGCWRGHMDIYRKMAMERIETALVLEDDADWDVTFRSQLTELARGSQYLQGIEPTETPHSPYGDNWWYIATGHCSVKANTKVDQKHWIIEQDPTVAPENVRDMPFYSPNRTPGVLDGPNKRLLFGLNGFWCTGSYAVSLKGASKIIYDQEVELNAMTIDMAVSALCAREGQGKCLGVYPPLTGIYIAAGSKTKESDRVNITEAEGRNEKARSNRLVYSTRLHLGSLLEGQTIVTSQFPGDTLHKEIDISKFQMPEGKPVVVLKTEYKKIEGEEEDDK